MSEVLGFEEKVQGLMHYYQAINKIDPKHPEHSEIADPRFFYYADGHHASFPLGDVRRGILHDMGSHALVEYNKRGLNAKDMREDTDELRSERADVLAVMTSPVNPSMREERAERIAHVLSSIVSGNSLLLTAYDSFGRRHQAPQSIDIDISRAVFGVLGGHMSNRDLTIQYDSPVTFAATEEILVGERVLRIEVPDLFKRNPLSIEPLAA